MAAHLHPDRIRYLRAHCEGKPGAPGLRMSSSNQSFMRCDGCPDCHMTIEDLERLPHPPILCMGCSRLYGDEKCPTCGCGAGIELEPGDLDDAYEEDRFFNFCNLYRQGMKAAVGESFEALGHRWTVPPQPERTAGNAVGSLVGLVGAGALIACAGWCVVEFVLWVLP